MCLYGVAGALMRGMHAHRPPMPSTATWPAAYLIHQPCASARVNPARLRTVARDDEGALQTKAELEGGGPGCWEESRHVGVPFHMNDVPVEAIVGCMRCY